MTRALAPVALALSILAGCATGHPKIADLKYNPGRYQNHSVTVDGAPVALTALEYRLLLLLVERRGRVQSRPQLLESVWASQPDIQTRTVDMHVQRLRSKLGAAGAQIETVRGFGYRFRAAEGGSRR